jgi:hypothetical protein
MRSNLKIKSLLGREMPPNGVYGGGGRYAASTCHGDAELNLMLAAVDASLNTIRGTGALR